MGAKDQSMARPPDEPRPAKRNVNMRGSPLHAHSYGDSGRRTWSAEHLEFTRSVQGTPCSRYSAPIPAGSPSPAAPLTACRALDSCDARDAATLSRRERVFRTVPRSVRPLPQWRTDNPVRPTLGFTAKPGLRQTRPVSGLPALPDGCNQPRSSLQTTENECVPAASGDSAASHARSQCFRKCRLVHRLGAMNHGPAQRSTDLAP